MRRVPREWHENLRVLVERRPELAEVGVAPILRLRLES